MVLVFLNTQKVFFNLENYKENDIKSKNMTSNIHLS